MNSATGMFKDFSRAACISNSRLINIQRTDERSAFKLQQLYKDPAPLSYLILSSHTFATPVGKHCADRSAE
jgi:hypothetical protein